MLCNFKGTNIRKKIQCGRLMEDSDLLQAQTLDYWRPISKGVKVESSFTLVFMYVMTIK